MDQGDKFNNYLLSNKKILEILTSDNKDDNNCSENDFYAISSEYINYWKSSINFAKLCENKKNKIDLNEMSNLNIDKERNNNHYYDGPFNPSLNLNIFEDFELVSKKALDSFVEEDKDINFKKAQIKKGLRKIILKESEKSYIILYLENISNKNVSPYQLEKYLNYIYIKIEKEPKMALINSFINEIIESDIYEWKIKNKFNIPNKTYLYKGIYFSFNKKSKKKDISSLFNVSLITPIQNELTISKSTQKSLIKDINYINKIIVVKIKNASFIIASISSLIQINDLVEYFLGENIIFNNCSKLLLEFQYYINNLWKRSLKNEKYEPSKFMKLLKIKDSKNFDFKNEKEPIIFLKNIFNYINKELNNKDKDIENELIHFKYNFKDEDFLNYYSNVFIKKNNSIISKLFYGIFIEKYICNSCGESHLFKQFDCIDLNITKYSEYLYESDKLDNSMVYYYLDDLIKFYFTDEYSICQKCNKRKKIEKKIIKFPNVLLFRIIWGQFSKEKGFDYEESLKKDKELMLEQNKLIFSDIIELTDFNYNGNNKKEYKIRSIINYPIINNNNKEDKSWQKFITFSRHLVDNHFYSYQPNGTVDLINKYNRKKFVPSFLFYEIIS